MNPHKMLCNGCGRLERPCALPHDCAATHALPDYLPRAERERRAAAAAREARNERLLTAVGR